MDITYCGKFLPDLPFPGVGEGACCFMAAALGPRECTCWEPVHDLAQADPRTTLDASPMPGMCGDCAYKPGSPERRDDPDVVASSAQLEQLVATGTPFWCHNGLRRLTHYIHPPTGTVYVPDGTESAYLPPIIDGRPYKADGSPADYCAGWTARFLKSASAAFCVRCQRKACACAELFAEADAKDDLTRFMDHVRPNELTGCWEWTGGRSHGYGSFWAQDGNHRAHRWLYCKLVGPVADDLVLDHLCRVRHCVNPDHLEPVPNGENVRRGDNANALKTHCPQGHAYTTANTLARVRTEGWASRHCRECENARRRRATEERRSANGLDPYTPPAERTHCPQGHPYDAANSSVSTEGHRRCRACARERVRRSRQAEGASA